MSSLSGSEVYIPPKQSQRGQLIDSLIILVLLMAVLFGVTYFVQSSSSSNTAKTKPLSQLGLTPAEQSQYKLVIKHGMTDLAGANQEVADQHPNNNQYPIKVVTLIITVAIIAIYLAFVYFFSFREYREVIREKFGSGESEPDLLEEA